MSKPKAKRKNKQVDKRIRGKRCTAKSKRTGKPCGRYAMGTTTKCYHHGGKSPGTPITHGRSSKKFRHLEAEGEAFIEELASDRAIADHAKTVATSLYTMMGALPLDPPETMVLALAKREFDTDKPDDGQLELARLKIAGMVSDSLTKHSRLQSAYSKDLARQEIVVMSALPIMREFVSELMTIIDATLSLKDAQTLRVEFSRAQLRAVARLRTAVDDV